MAVHLWTDGPPPLPYIQLVLCRDVYHCTPRELARIPWEVIQEHMICLDMEAKVSRARAR